VSGFLLALPIALPFFTITFPPQAIDPACLLLYLFAAFAPIWWALTTYWARIRV